MKSPAHAALVVESPAHDVMMSNSVPEREKETLTGCVSFYTQWIDICVCIRVRGLHLVSEPRMLRYDDS